MSRAGRPAWSCSGGRVAVRVADLGSPARGGLGKDGRTALTAAGAGPIRTGDLVVFCRPVAVAAAVVRRDGRVRAAGHPADHVRLGVAEERLDALCGEPGVIGKVAAGVTLTGRVKGAARRAMTAAMVIRLVLPMTLMPGSCYAEAITALLGGLPLVPWHRRYRVPAPAVACSWRDAVGAAPLEELRDRMLAGAGAGHRDHDWRAVLAGALEVGSIDGSLTRMPDTPANGTRSGPRGPPTGPRRTRSCGSCAARSPRPAPPWAR